MRKNTTFMATNVNISYWEYKHYFTEVDLIVIGSGIVGLNAAYYFKKNNPKSKVLVSYLKLKLARLGQVLKDLY